MDRLGLKRGRRGIEVGRVHKLFVGVGRGQSSRDGAICRFLNFRFGFLLKIVDGTLVEDALAYQEAGSA